MVNQVEDVLICDGYLMSSESLELGGIFEPDLDNQGLGQASLRVSDSLCRTPETKVFNVIVDVDVGGPELGEPSFWSPHTSLGEVKAMESASGSPGSLTSTASGEAETMEELLSDMLSFKGCEELLRGTRLSTIMAGRCALFRHSKGSAITFSKSEMTAGLDAFVSHNWSVPARRKFLVLSYFYNGGRVTLVTMGVLGVMGAATYLHWLPEIEDKSMPGRKVGFLGRLLWFPIGSVLFVYWWDLVRLFRYQGPLLFLDKVCIHQTDAQLMKRGISKLGAFIKDSKQMLSLYSEEYLRRLWTVYEIATFLSIHKTEDLILLPITVPILAIVTMLVLWFLEVGHFLSMLYTDSTYARAVLGAFGCVALLISFRVLFRNKEAMVATIATFSVHKCVCAEESDRAQVYLNIEALMRSVKTFEPGTTREDVLAAFSQEVKEELPRALTKQMGKFILPYDKVLAVGIFNQVPWIVDKMCLLDHPTNWEREALVMYHNILWSIVFAPFAILLIQVVASCRTKFCGIKNELVWFVLASTFTVNLFTFITVLTFWAAESSLYNIILNVLALVVVITGCCFLRQ